MAVPIPHRPPVRRLPNCRRESGNGLHPNLRRCHTRPGTSCRKRGSRCAGEWLNSVENGGGMRKSTFPESVPPLNDQCPVVVGGNIETQEHFMRGSPRKPYLVQWLPPAPNRRPAPPGASPKEPTVSLTRSTPAANPSPARRGLAAPGGRPAPPLSASGNRNRGCWQLRRWGKIRARRTASPAHAGRQGRGRSGLRHSFFASE